MSAICNKVGAQSDDLVGYPCSDGRDARGDRGQNEHEGVVVAIAVAVDNGSRCRADDGGRAHGVGFEAMQVATQ